MSRADAIARSVVSIVIVVTALWLPPAWSANISEVDVHHDGDRYFLSLEAHLDAPPWAVFAVITDYENIHGLHRRIRESRIIRRIDPRTVEVFTVLKGCVAAVFCKSVRRVERIVETPPTELLATVIPGQSDLASGSVRWRLESSDAGTLLRYDSDMEPDFWVPGLLGDSLLQMSIRRTTEDMIQEVEIRARALVVGEGEELSREPS